jgi:uncharacterized protein
VIVVTDTSVILNLCLLRQENLLIALFGKILAPIEVVAEFERLAATDPRFSGLVFPPFIHQLTAADSVAALARDARLHKGELSALALAMEHRADAVLMDERAGRSAAAALGLKVFGLLGILLAAHHRSLVPALSPLLDRLQNEARFWISPSLRETVLLATGEFP